MSTPTPKKTAAARNVDPAHVMDYGNLNLGHPAPSKRTVTLVDLDAYVYGLDETSGQGPLTAIIIAHGWANKARDLEPMAAGLLGEIRRVNGGAAAVMVVTLDQRNHGKRRRIRNETTISLNTRRVVTNGLAIAGGQHDHELVLDWLAAELFPNNESEIAQWMAVGISMGGNITWDLVRSDPRIRVAVPIISCPIYPVGDQTMVWAKDDARKGQEPVPSAWPTSMRKYFARPSDLKGYEGKHILALHGDLDSVIPRRVAQPHIDELQAAGVHVEQWEQQGRGHVVTPEMVQRAAEFLWRNGPRGQWGRL